MGIRLDWEIEAENERLQSGGEDPESRRRRWKARLRVFGVLIVFALLIGALIGGLILRLRQVDWEIEQALRDTVETEVATLRLGDHATFMGLQRSATDEWLVRQDGLFDEYQALKIEADVQLTGQVLDALVDRQRGRVQVEEVVNGARYVRTWFYWRYEDGWRHVPPDYTFWGEQAALQNERLTVRYQELDAPFAQIVYDQLNAWLETGCAALVCNPAPQLMVDIQPNPLTRIEWADAWTLHMPSPYLGRASIDAPFETSARFQTAVLLARRLVDSTATAQTLAGEGLFLRDAVISWLVEHFAQVEMDSHLIYSLAARYGDPAVGALLARLTPETTVGVLSEITGTPLEQAGLDWRDYVAWRLGQESGGQEVEVTGTLVEYDVNGVPQIRAQALIGAAQTEVVYQWVNGGWQRVR